MFVAFFPINPKTEFKKSRLGVLTLLKCPLGSSSTAKDQALRAATEALRPPWKKSPAALPHSLSYQQESLSTALLQPQILSRGLDKGHDRWLLLCLLLAQNSLILGSVTHRHKKRQFRDFKMLCEQFHRLHDVYFAIKKNKLSVFYLVH